MFAQLGYQFYEVQSYIYINVSLDYSADFALSLKKMES